MGDDVKEIMVLFTIDGLVIDQLYDIIKKLELIQNKYEKLEIDHTYLKRTVNRVTCTLTTNDYIEAFEVFELLFQFPLPEAEYDEYYDVQSYGIDCHLIIESDYKKK